MTGTYIPGVQPGAAGQMTGPAAFPGTTQIMVCTAAGVIDFQTIPAAAGSPGALQASDGSGGLSDSGLSYVGDVLEISNGLSGQTVEMYGEKLDDSNYSRLCFKSGVAGFSSVEWFQVSAESAGSIAAQHLSLKSPVVNITSGSGSSATLRLGFPGNESNYCGEVSTTGFGETTVKAYRANGMTWLILTGGTNSAYGIKSTTRHVFEDDVEISGSIRTPTMQTSDPGIAGEWWNDGGTPKISAG
jgi:hypothetical protein